ncbi:gll0032 [Gloeobacter violaceus PCC 7421]|uniref:Gll0032 protein n=2 Tax=Gloeobacter violaceus TaxID=33072 RepID=Q7NPM3_GLOVI|nr:gll0032 [Gloeobacter violaceus PCC 7421]
MSGSLIVVGTGIRAGHLSQEAISAVRTADAVAYCIAEPLTRLLVDELRKEAAKPVAEDLHRFYADGKPRTQTYHQMVARILELVRLDLQVAAVFYGHPGVFAYPSHESIRQARAEGYPAEMLPGISAVDCLFADLGVDPATAGCQMLEATDFLLRRRHLDTACGVVLWQIGCVGHGDYQGSGYDLRYIPMLVEALLAFYPPEHEVVVYQAAHFAMCDPIVECVAIAEMLKASITAVSTLYIPPLLVPAIDSQVLKKFDIATFRGTEG